MSNEQRNHEQQQDFSAFGPRLDEVVERELRWMWEGYLLSGKLNGLIGDADKGKSLVMLDIAARLSRGWPMPLETGDALEQDRRLVVRAPGNIILLCAEDGPADTIVPRLRVAGADLTHIFLLEHYPDAHGHTQFMNFADSMAREQLLAAIRQVDAKLLIVDPLAAFMGRSGTTDMNKEQDMRSVLSSFIKALEDTDCCVWAIRHQGKDSRNREPVHRALGSTAITAMFRSEWAVNADPHDDALRVFNKVKNNLAVSMPSLAFHIEDTGGQDGKRPIPFIVWDGVSIWDAHALSNEVETFSPRMYVKRLLSENRGHMLVGPMRQLILKDPAYKAVKSENAIKNLLHTMAKSGELVCPHRGEYALPGGRTAAAADATDATAAAPATRAA